MPKRLIDIISPSLDRLDPAEDWRLLMTPFNAAMSLSPEDAAAGSVYAHKDSRNTEWRYTALKLNGRLNRGTTADEVRKNLAMFDSGRRPSLVAGEPGVGKTTLLKNFFERDEVQLHNFHCFVDGTRCFSAVSDAPPEKHIRSCLRSKIFRALQERGDRMHIELPVKGMSPHEGDNTRAVDLIQRSAQILRGKRCNGWVILDNFDRRTRREQELAIEMAKNIPAELGLGAVVTVRPYSVKPSYLPDFIPLAVVPPDFAELISNRVGWALDSDNGQELLEYLRETAQIQTNWTGALINDRQSLGSLWNRVGDALCHMELLHRFLQKIHLGDLHCVLSDLSRMLGTTHFANEIARRMSPGATGNGYDFLTAYLCGDFYHHRQTRGSGEFLLNLYYVPNAARRDQLLNVRVLQFLRRICMGAPAIRYDELREQLLDFGYGAQSVDRVAANLVKRRLVLEVGRMADWEDQRLCLEPSDELVISESGEFYLEVLTGEPRYIQAMSHVTPLPDHVVDSMRTNVPSTADDEYTNSYVLMREVGDLVREEMARLDTAGKLRRFLECIDTGPGFYFTGVQSCLHVARKLAQLGRIKTQTQSKWEELYRNADNIRNRKLAIHAPHKVVNWK